MGAINAMPSYQETFNLSGAGSSTGIIFIIYNCGQIAAFPFCGFLADGYGRRICIFVGCLLVLVGMLLAHPLVDALESFAYTIRKVPLSKQPHMASANSLGAVSFLDLVVSRPKSTP